MQTHVKPFLDCKLLFALFAIVFYCGILFFISRALREATVRRVTGRV